MLRSVASSDRRSFTALYRKTSRLCYGVIFRMIRNEEEAADILQEVYVRIWVKSPQFLELTCSAESWIVTIARHASIDRLRAQGRRPEILDTDYHDIVDRSPTPEGVLLGKSLAKRLDSCLGELPEERALAVRRAYMEGWSYVELAQSADVPLNTMRTWLRRSLLRLRTCLQATDF